VLLAAQGFRRDRAGDGRAERPPHTPGGVRRTPARDPDAGETALAWRDVRADRVACLIDGCAYFAALRQALLGARRSVHLIGWELDTRVELRGAEPPDDGWPLCLGELLGALVARRRRLHVHVQLWDFSSVLASDRQRFL